MKCNPEIRQSKWLKTFHTFSSLSALCSELSFHYDLRVTGHLLCICFPCKENCTCKQLSHTLQRTAGTAPSRRKHTVCFYLGIDKESSPYDENDGTNECVHSFKLQ